MIIGAISDLHASLPNTEAWPQLDVMIIGGDSFPDFHLPSDQVIQKQIEFIDQQFNPWLKTIKAKHILGIGGNHDHSLTSDFIANSVDWTFLSYNSIVIDGIKFYGCPATFKPEGFNHWAFGHSELELVDVYNKIDKDTNVLISHTPPHGVNDLGFGGGNKGMCNFGSISLRRYLSQSPFPLPNLRLMTTSHIHEYNMSMDWSINKQNGNRKTFKFASIAAAADYFPNQPLSVFKL